MLAAKAGQSHFLAAVLILALSCAAVRAAGAVVVPAPDEVIKPIDETTNKQNPGQTCAAYYRIDDVTEINDEIRRCLIPREAGNNPRQ
ncbi:hypothetical protein JDV02_000140 [Purpureocillium takamizusanense]|uniref:Uncharacterized protein n=1 Tax=Purpureocillium takamizusanense TaxID=2060973 RepID=A0A9Q8Q5Z2_9HYPO|nr:uncharacterized protein JDV02_000140 [Purpureocillium takamizusanense]UNI13392.1 hypothetical protein JDV02_000140 [Purpureocillium takamizusanense]